jgi:hypothetical protein
MAKDLEKTAGNLGGEKAGSKASTLLADEKDFDRRILWRIGGWGLAAVGTLVVAVLANQGAQSWRQDRISAADLARQAQLLQSVARETQNNQRQLTAAIETLNSDRDRLYARVTVLEQSLDSVTGALTKQASPQASGQSQAFGRAAGASSSVSVPPATLPIASDAQQGSPFNASSATLGSSAADSSVVAPAVAPIATTTPIASNDKARADALKPGASLPPAASSQPLPSVAAMSAMASAPVPSAPSSGAGLVAPKSIMAPPDPAATKLTEPEKVAKLEFKAEPKGETRARPQIVPPADTAEAVVDAVHKTEFAVDLGAANSIGGLRALWRGLVKANTDLATLHPIIMVKEGTTGLGMQLRLGAGPLNDAAAAARICASLSESQRPCETTVYDGQRLATRDDNEGAGKQPAAAGEKSAPNAAGTLPANQRRRSYQQRHGATREPQAAEPAAAPPQQQPEQKAEPASISSLFRRPS